MEPANLANNDEWTNLRRIALNIAKLLKKSKQTKGDTKVRNPTTSITLKSIRINLMSKARNHYSTYLPKNYGFHPTGSQLGFEDSLLSFHLPIAPPVSIILSQKTLFTTKQFNTYLSLLFSNSTFYYRYFLLQIFSSFTRGLSTLRYLVNLRLNSLNFS